ncbi:MAG: TPM domain-containing protein [Cytophagales bacterium]
MKHIFFYFLFLSITITGFSKELPQKPNPQILVNDFANVLSAEQKTALERKLFTYNDSTSTQITVVIENSIENEEVFDYSMRLAQAWGIGQKGKNNGLLIYIALQERKIRIQVGYGLEATVTDSYSKRIIEEVMKPAFRNQQYYEGLDEATNYLISALSGQFKGDGGAKGKLSGKSILIFLAILFGIFWLLSKFGGGGGTNYNRGGGSGMSLLTGMLLGSALSSGRGSSYGSFSSGGGSFGGFGGGSFGGGGAGGDW